MSSLEKLTPANYWTMKPFLFNLNFSTKFTKEEWPKVTNKITVVVRKLFFDVPISEEELPNFTFIFVAFERLSKVVLFERKPFICLDM